MRKSLVNMKQLLWHVPDPAYIGKAIFCPQQNAEISETACPERILAFTDNRLLGKCRACPRGLMLMSTVSGKGRYCQPEEPAQPEKQPLPPQEETTMAEAQKTYTMHELAALLGVAYKGIKNTRQFKDASSRPGSRAYAIREALRERGISWDQVVPDKRGGRRKKTLDAPEPIAAEVVAAKANVEVPVEKNEEATVPESEEPALLQALRDMEPEGVSEERAAAQEALFADDWKLEDEGRSGSAVPPADVAPTPPPGSSVLDDMVLDFVAPESTLGAPSRLRELQAACGYDIVLKEVPLEELVREISRRMPRSEVVLR